MNRPRSLVLIVAVLAVAAGCSATPKPAATSSTLHLNRSSTCDSNPTEQQVLDFRAPKANKPYNIALMEVNLAGYYYQANVYGAEQAAKGAGVTLTTSAGQGYASPALQVSWCPRWTVCWPASPTRSCCSRVTSTAPCRW